MNTGDLFILSGCGQRCWGVLEFSGWGIDTKNYTPQFLEAPTRQKRPSLESYIMRTFAGKVEKGGLESGIVFNGVWEVVIIGALWDNVGLRCRKRE